MKQTWKKLEEIINLGIEVSQISDLDVLLEKILSEARNLVNADAGSIYIKEENNLKFSYAQNETLRKKLGKGKKLIYTTFSMPITKSSIAGFVASEGEALNIQDAYKIPKSKPYSFNSSYDKLTGYQTHSMLTVPLKNNRGDIIGVLQVINAQDDNGNIIPFSKEDVGYIGPFAMYAAVAIERAQLTRTTIMRMISMAELRDPKETGAHVNRVAAYSLEIYEHWSLKKGIPRQEIDKQRDAFRMAAMLHDVGKVAISDTILKKPGRFTEEEYEVMKQHAPAGARLFSGARSAFDVIAAEVALTHHERWDGKGYPGWIDANTMEPIKGHMDKDGNAAGKKGEEIPIWGRIVALADVFDALSSNRVYKEAWTEEDVLDTIKEDRGTHFDPEVVDSFFEVYDQIKSISLRYPNS
ncbi:MAG: HD domain-containing protein [Calditrichales bacterium]|nr:MAG: HD domain-containing protein [Calditrichales bacterium]